MPLFRRPTPPEDTQVEVVDTAVPSPDDQLPPSRMRGTESLYGYVVALELLVVAILNIVITKGKGAPAHPQTGLQIIGVAAPLVLVGVIQTRNRTIVGFAAIVAAFFVTLPKVPTSLAIPHVLALAVPLAYGLIITQRQRRAVGNAARKGSRVGANGNARSSRGQGTTDAGAGRRRGRKAGKGGKEEVPQGPRPNARYTPPKAKRAPQGKATR